ncbi:monosaccharide-sensing protein 2 [Cryptomeria japonica]|uniref:monosaccharide-sensing protein 2 n=1 Tax=Cryptomeria japonica TaxID=3369 RepID=UPI0027DA3515|nr:monosaccharide-sensing protein 2 [Cryptomeria japonica]XP_057864755.2 monosaccharide-sensing protein 2 [Cryptomeria japonica]XP_057864756.2 monosaccharide-sensing protein 2 [Cryptomeria japonica]
MAPPQCIAASIAIGNFLQGWDSAAIAGAILYITIEFELDETTTGLLVSISIIGGLCSTLLAGVFADTFGRRKILSVAGIVYLLSALGMALSPTVYILFVARFLVGCAYGLSATVVPLLISETAPSDIRGQLATFPQLTNSLGTFTAYFALFLLSLRDTASWRLMTAALGAPAFVYICLCILYLPESPRWLVKKGRMNEAKQTLQRLLNKEDVADDLTLVVEGLGSGKDVTIEEYVVEPAEAITSNEQQKQDGEQIHLYGLEEEWIAKPASCVESAPINSYRLIDPTVALIESFRQIPVFENIDQIDGAHESSQWDLENQEHEDQTDSEEDEETSILEESVPNTPMLDHDWGLDRFSSNQADSLRAPFLSQNNSSYAEPKSTKGKMNWGTGFLNNLQSAGNVKNSSKNSGHMKFSMNGSLPENMGLGGGWQVAYQLQQSESNQSASLKRVFLYAGSASHIPSAVGSIRSLKSLPGLEGRESMQVSALVGEPALSLTQNNNGPSSENVVGPAIMHPSKMSTKGIQWSDFCDVRVKRALTVGMTLQMLQQESLIFNYIFLVLLNVVD